MSRVVCQFSKGAASAVATKLALGQFAGREIAIVNAFIEEEHPDNLRFAADCERWFDHPITATRRTTGYPNQSIETWNGIARKALADCRNRSGIAPTFDECADAIARALYSRFVAQS